MSASDSNMEQEPITVSVHSLLHLHVVQIFVQDRAEELVARITMPQSDIQLPRDSVSIIHIHSSGATVTYVQLLGGEFILHEGQNHGMCHGHWIFWWDEVSLIAHSST